MVVPSETYTPRKGGNNMHDLTMVRDMTPGANYRGTKDGPSELDGVVFTVLATVSFNAVCGGIPHDECDEYDGLTQVIYDAWAWPFPMTCVMAPGDVVERMAL